MTDSMVMQLVTNMLLVSLKVSGPVLLVALVVGVAISILQAATQVQEMTLTYVPKLVAMAVVIALLGPWMLHVMTAFTADLLGNLARYAH